MRMATTSIYLKGEITAPLHYLMVLDEPPPQFNQRVDDRQPIPQDTVGWNPPYTNQTVGDANILP